MAEQTAEELADNIANKFLDPFPLEVYNSLPPINRSIAMAIFALVDKDEKFRDILLERQFEISNILKSGLKFTTPSQATAFGVLHAFFLDRDKDRSTKDNLNNLIDLKKAMKILIEDYRVAILLTLFINTSVAMGVDVQYSTLELKDKLREKIKEGTK